MPDTLRLSSPNNSPKLSLRSTALFRTRTFLPTSTGSSATVLYHLILRRRMSKNPNIKEKATASREKLPDAILGYHLTLATLPNIPIQARKNKNHLQTSRSFQKNCIFVSNILSVTTSESGTRYLYCIKQSRLYLWHRLY